MPLRDAGFTRTPSVTDGTSFDTSFGSHTAKSVILTRHAVGDRRQKLIANNSTANQETLMPPTNTTPSQGSSANAIRQFAEQYRLNTSLILALFGGLIDLHEQYWSTPEYMAPPVPPRLDDFLNQIRSRLPVPLHPELPTTPPAPTQAMQSPPVVAASEAVVSVAAQAPATSSEPAPARVPQNVRYTVRLDPLVKEKTDRLLQTPVDPPTTEAKELYCLKRSVPEARLTFKLRIVVLGEKAVRVPGYVTDDDPNTIRIVPTHAANAGTLEGTYVFDVPGFKITVEVTE